MIAIQLAIALALASLAEGARADPSRWTWTLRAEAEGPGPAATRHRLTLPAMGLLRIRPFVGLRTRFARTARPGASVGLFTPPPSGLAPASGFAPGSAAPGKASTSSDVASHGPWAPVPTVTDGQGRVAAVVRAGLLEIVLTDPSPSTPWQAEVELLRLDAGPCAVDGAPLRMRWRACAAPPSGLASGAAAPATGALPLHGCHEGPPCADTEACDRGRFLPLPALGPVAREAHLVTEADVAGGAAEAGAARLEEARADGAWWPASAREGLAAHLARSEALTRLPAAEATENWAPAGEGGSRWGEGAAGRPVPVLDEAWYATMYWARRPPPGTRMLVLEPWSLRAAVAAGGWETGPGSVRAIGGVSEELQRALGVRHMAPLLLGFLVDPEASLGPLAAGCWPDEAGLMRSR